MPQYNYITDEVFTVDEFFSVEECEEAIMIAENLGFADASVTTSLGPQMMPQLRNNERVILDDSEWAAELWQGITDYIPQSLDKWTACGVNERLRFYRYDAGQRFDWHRDGAFRRNGNERSFLTFMVYLHAGCEGGSTLFQDFQIVPQAGTALFFNHPLMHCGQEVVSGRKYVLRTDVMYRFDG